MDKKFLEKFNKTLLDELRKTIFKYGFFDYPISPSAEITERDFCMVLSDIFRRQEYEYSMEFLLGGKRIDLYIKHDDCPHYIEIKDCGIFEIKYGKSLAFSEEIESGRYDKHNPDQLSFGIKYRTEAKTKWLNYYQRQKSGRGSEGLSKDVYKFYELFQAGFLKTDDLCSCIAFVFWPQPFPEKGNYHFAQIKKGAETIEVGTIKLIEQLEKQTKMKNITYNIDTINLPEVSILNPYEGKFKTFDTSKIKLTIEILSWIN